ncbi:uncharacterized protein LOC117890805 [Drosophila subobscura]|uniref:uncharacterized protein LOC117890805 n=1 Tax=Drosophila subobscura TaxID=7241 RepID=UPI00155B1204|nr:uncharacterized protein LOC117890805 [Drosophila subobscura]
MRTIRFAPLLACFFVLGCLSSVAASPAWSFDQVGGYFNGILRSVFGPLFGFGNTTTNFR